MVTLPFLTSSTLLPIMENLKRKGCSESSTQERKRQKGEAPQDPAEKEK